jgi:hypothetical protein
VRAYTKNNTPRWSNGRIAGFQSAVEGSIPSRGTDKQNVAKPGIAVAVATDRRFNSDRSDLKNRAEVQMEARLLWEQEGFGSTPRRPANEVVEDWLS